VNCRAQLIEEMFEAAVVTDLPASRSTTKGISAADAWDFLNELA